MRFWAGGHWRAAGGGRRARALLLGAAAGVLLAATQPPAARAQEDIAYIDSKQVLEQLPEYATVQQRLDRLTQQWEQEIAAQRARVDTLQQEFQARAALYPEEERRRRRSSSG